MTAGGCPIKVLRRLLVFVLIVVALYLLLPRLVGAEKAGELISQANWALLVFAVVIEGVALTGYANLFRFILHVLDIRLSLGTMVKIVLAGLAASHLFSAGGAAGWVVSYNALRKRGVPHGLVFVAIAAQNFFNYIVLWVLFLLSMVYLVGSGKLNPFAYTAALILIGFFLWLTGYGLYLYNHRAKMRRRVTQVARLINRITRSERIKPEHIDGWLDSLFAGMRRMTTHRGSVRMSVLYSLSFWFFDLLCLYLVFWAFTTPPSIPAMIVAYVVGYAVGTLAPTPGGLGAVEGLLIAMFVSFGVDSSEAVAVVLTYRLINFWLPIPPGLVSYVALR